MKHLFDAMASVAVNLPDDQQRALIKVHPDLANKTQRATALTSESSAEQNGAGVDRLSDAEFAAFERLNEAYRTKFRFSNIIGARRHRKDSILHDFEWLSNDAATETKTAVEENLPNSALLLDQLVLSDDCLKLHGQLSTHVLDTHAGGCGYRDRTRRIGRARREGGCARG